MRTVLLSSQHYLYSFHSKNSILDGRVCMCALLINGRVDSSVTFILVHLRRHECNRNGHKLIKSNCCSNNGRKTSIYSKCIEIQVPCISVKMYFGRVSVSLFTVCIHLTTNKSVKHQRWKQNKKYIALHIYKRTNKHTHKNGCCCCCCCFSITMIIISRIMATQ